MAWGDRITVQKGDLGESIMDEFLKSHGVIPYQPVFNGAHPFDRLCASLDKKRLFIAETKTKPRRIHYPDTGIDIKHYENYKYVMNEYNIDVWLTFIDEKVGQMYGNFLSVLDQKRVIGFKTPNIPGYVTAQPTRQNMYPLFQGEQVYFPVQAMRVMQCLTVSDARKIASKSSRKECYDLEYEIKGMAFDGELELIP